MEATSISLESGLALWLAVANKMWQRWRCIGSSLGSGSFLCLLFFFQILRLPDEQVQVNVLEDKTSWGEFILARGTLDQQTAADLNHEREPSQYQWSHPPILQLPTDAKMSLGKTRRNTQPTCSLVSNNKCLWSYVTEFWGSLLCRKSWLIKPLTALSSVP